MELQLFKYFNFFLSISLQRLFLFYIKMVNLITFLLLTFLLLTEHKRTTKSEAARLKDLAHLSIVQFQNGFHRMNFEFVSFRMIPNL